MYASELQHNCRIPWLFITTSSSQCDVTEPPNQKILRTPLDVTQAYTPCILIRSFTTIAQKINCFHKIYSPLNYLQEEDLQ